MKTCRGCEHFTDDAIEVDDDGDIYKLEVPKGIGLHIQGLLEGWYTVETLGQKELV